MNKKSTEKWVKDGNVLLTVAGGGVSRTLVFWGPKHGLYTRRQLISQKKPLYCTIKRRIYEICNFKKLGVAEGKPAYWCSAAFQMVEILCKKLPYPNALKVLRAAWNAEINKVPPMAKTMLSKTPNRHKIFPFLLERNDITSLPVTKKNVKQVKRQIIEACGDHICLTHDIKITDKNLNVYYDIALSPDVPLALVPYLLTLGYTRYKLIKSAKNFILNLSDIPPEESMALSMDRWPKLQDLQEWVKKYQIDTRTDLNLKRALFLGYVNDIVPSNVRDKGEKLHLARYGTAERIAVCNNQWVKRVIDHPDPIGFISYIQQDDHCEECASRYDTNRQTLYDGELF